MDTARIAALLQPFLQSAEDLRQQDCHSEPAKAGEESSVVLSHAQLEGISTYIDILARWNARINLTAIRDSEEIVLRHFGESLFAASQLLSSLSFESSGSSVVHSYSVADIGSGAGFPGLPFKLWCPQISLTLIESNHKKVTFLREVVRSLALTNVNVENARAESLTETFDLVMLRAVENFASILPIAAARVAPGGRVGLLIGSAQIEPARALLPEYSWSPPVPIPHSRARVVLVGSRPPIN